MSRDGVYRIQARSKILNGCHFESTDRFQGDWLATGIESGSKFVAIDLTEGEWFDYDEKAGEEVSIKDLKWEIRRN